MTWEPRRYPFISPKMINTQGTWNTDNHHHTRCSPQSPKVKLSHDAPIGSRTPARTGEERPRKGVVELSHLFSDPSPNGAQWPDCTLSSLSPKVESKPVGDPVVSDPMHPRRDTSASRQDPNTVREEPMVLSTVSLATHDEF